MTNILLTGAGLSRNWGGALAKDCFRTCWAALTSTTPLQLLRDEIVAEFQVARHSEHVQVPLCQGGRGTVNQAGRNHQSPGNAAT
jgi:hypothetical protein